MASSGNHLTHPHVLTEEQKQYEKNLILREYRKLLRLLKTRLENDEDGKRKIHDAFKMAADAHRNMRRTSGEPYVLHPIEVAKICNIEMGLGVRSIVSSLLHDVVEDTHISLQLIEQKFGKEIAHIVDGLTKINVITSNQSEVSAQAENFKRILFSIVDDPRIIFIKLADRLHNMRTLGLVSREKQIRISSETMYIYAPLAHRLGFSRIKSELEDLSLKYSHPEEYANIENKIEDTRIQRTKFIVQFAKPIKESLDADGGIEYKVSGRTKSIYSIWNKMKNKDVRFDEVMDQFAIRIIIKNAKNEKEEIENCWKVYSIVASHYQSIPSRMRDWLSVPKSNGYTALHMTVMTPTGRAVEVQIRSERMNEIAEQGMAAHWKYKEGKKGGESIFDSWLLKIRKKMEESSDISSIDFLMDFKQDFLSDEIYVFTNKGDTKLLPSRSTVLDFAYTIHSQIGNQCFAAKVNNKIVPISHILSSGDQVEIITSVKQVPKTDWLNIVVTHKARTKIKEALNAKKRQIAQEGKEIFERKQKNWKVKSDEKLMTHLLKTLKIPSLVDFYSTVAKEDGFLHKIKDVITLKGTPKELLGSKEEKEKNNTPSQYEKAKIYSAKEIEIFGEVDPALHHTFAQCCSPVPGDEIFGFISRNPEEGIRIHKMNCTNAPYLFANFAYRIVKTHWASQISRLFETSIFIEGIDSFGFINEITSKISSHMHLNIAAMNIESKEEKFSGVIRLYVKDKDQLDELLDFFHKHPSITSVRREDDE